MDVEAVIHCVTQFLKTGNDRYSAVLSVHLYCLSLAPPTRFCLLELHAYLDNNYITNIISIGSKQLS
jgi:hypothetical protein